MLSLAPASPGAIPCFHYPTGCDDKYSQLLHFAQFQDLSAGYVKTQFIKNHDAPGTINERITRFKALIRWGYDNDYISDINYLKKIKPLPDKEARRKTRS